MKSLIIYDSNYGSTKMIAEAIGKELGSKVVNVNDYSKKMLKGVELLIVGSPIIGWRPTEKTSAILATLGENSLQGVKVTSFDTRIKLFIHGDAMNKILKTLEQAGGEVIAAPQAFYVKGREGVLFDGEIKQAVIWAKTIKKS